MDPTVKSLAEYAHGLCYSDIPLQTVHECKRRVIDTFGAALGAFNAEPSRITRSLAQIAAPAGARILGTGHRTLPELAAFANGTMARYLDANDAYPGGGGHPSDVIAAVCVSANASKVNGKTLILGIVLAYEIFHILWTATKLRNKGMDHAFYGTVGGAVGAAKVMGLTQEQIEQAISLAVVPNISLDATRYGCLDGRRCGDSWRLKPSRRRELLRCKNAIGDSTFSACCGT